MRYVDCKFRNIDIFVASHYDNSEVIILQFEIYEARYMAVDRVVTSKLRAVKLYEFDLFNNVSRTVTVDNIAYVTDSNCIVCRRPGQTVRSTGCYDNYILTLAVDETQTDNQLITKEMMDSLPVCFYPAHVEELKEILKKIIRTYQYDKKAQILQNDLHRFLFLLLSDSFENAAAQIKEKSSRIYTVISYIAQHYAEKLDMDHLASLIHLDKCYFIRYFKKKTGMTPQQYLINKRLQEAKALLSRLDLPVSEIAYMVGYSNVTHFVSSFKKYVGISPNQYRSGFLD